MSLKHSLLSQSAVMFAARILGAGVIFLTQAAIARSWGAEYLGSFLIIVAVVNLAATVMPLGFQTIGTFFAAEYRASGDAASLKKFVMRSYLHIGVLGVVFGVIGGPVAHVFGQAGDLVSSQIFPVAIMAVSTALIYTNATILVGLRRPFAGLLAEALARPLVVVSGVVIISMLYTQNKMDGLVLFLALGFATIAIGQSVLVVRSLKALPDSTKASGDEPRRWWRFAVPWVLIALATEFFFDIDLVLLAGHMDTESLAVFGVCTRIFSLVSFGIVAVYAVTVPDIFEADVQKNDAQFKKRLGEANMIAVLVAGILVSAVFMGGKIALSVFGPEFDVGVWPLLILCTGLFVRAMFGPSSMILSLRDRPYASLPAVGIGMVSLLVFNYLLVAPLGILGAALAALGAITITSAGLWITARKITGIDVSVLASARLIKRALGRIMLLRRA